MITYKAEYAQGSRPKLVKVISAGSDSVEIKLSPAMDKEELNLIPLSSLYEHLENYVLFFKDYWVNTVEVYNLGDADLDGRFPFRGYSEVDLTMYESMEWWQYIYNNRESE